MYKTIIDLNLFVVFTKIKIKEKIIVVGYKKTGATYFNKVTSPQITSDVSLKNKTFIL